MITIQRAKFGIPITEIFFAGRPDEVGTNSTIHFFVQARQPAPGLMPFKTPIIDLSKGSDELGKTLSSNTRYKIRRAEREALTPDLSYRPTDEEILTFSEYVDAFACQKKIAGGNPRKLRALRDESALILTYMRDSSGDLLCAHAYVRDADLERARLLYSASLFREMSSSNDRNAVGRANRFLHWYEMNTFPEHGIRYYDLGGLPIDESDPEKNAIARFKLEFGGAQVTEYSGFIGGNSLGKALLALRNPAATPFFRRFVS